MSTLENRRILLVDDQASIHEDFRKVLTPPASSTDLETAEALLFDPLPSAPPLIRFEMDSAFQGAEGLEKVRAARLAGLLYAMAFIDMRMPPGWDGVETAERLWLEEPRLQIVCCTAYSDTSWTEVTTRLDARDRSKVRFHPSDEVTVRRFRSPE